MSYEEMKAALELQFNLQYDMDDYIHQYNQRTQSNDETVDNLYDDLVRLVNIVFPNYTSQQWQDELSKKLFRWVKKIYTINMKKMTIGPKISDVLTVVRLCEQEEQLRLGQSRTFPMVNKAEREKPTDPNKIEYAAGSEQKNEQKERKKSNQK